MEEIMLVGLLCIKSKSKKENTKPRKHNVTLDVFF